MKRPLHLSLAIALAISGVDATALGLGTIQVKSRLNQPLEAEIPVIQSNPGEAEGLIVQLASAEDFERVGLDRARSVAVPLEFKLISNAQGQAVIRVTTADIVRDPFLDFLIEANWTNGRLLREYTVLLDPPVMAAAVKGSTTIAAPAEPQRAAVEPLPEPSAKPAPKTPAAPPPVARTPSPPAAPRQTASAAGDYAVQNGDTLSAIARQVRPDAGVSLDQTMLALFKANPSAFYKDNINALKSGAILRVPDAEAIKSVASLREAAEQVRGQVEDWRGTAGSPTRVARTTTDIDAPAAGVGTRAADASRLSIVPPAVGKDSLAANDRVGASSAASGSGDVRLKGELARAQEALASREQESGELKSRVRELEDLKSKNDRLLSLKDSEIAELQQRLKALQEDGQGAKPAGSTAPTSAPPAGSAAPDTSRTSPTKDDIWGRGDAASAPPASASPAAPQTPAVPSATAPADATVTPEPPPAGTPDQPAEPAPLQTPPPTDTITTSGSDTAVVPAPAPAAQPKPAAKTPPRPAANQPAAATDDPWFMDPKVLGGAGAIGLLLILLGFVGLRKRRPPAGRSSIAESFGDSPLPAAGLVGAAHATDAVEAALRSQIDANPADLGARLELLSHFYAERRVGDFEAGALDMNDYVIDRSQPEWLEVQAMGRELLPGNPLFFDQGAEAELPIDEAEDDEFAFDTPAADPFEPTHAAPAPVTDFDFDFEQPQHTPHPVAPVPAAKADDDDGFDFGDLPPLDFQSEIDAAARDTAERATLAQDASTPLEDEFFVGDDAVDTKLDLARTYLDMGDPDGARAMLEEVLAEGSQVQKDEARRLLGGIA